MCNNGPSLYVGACYIQIYGIQDISMIGLINFLKIKSISLKTLYYLIYMHILRFFYNDRLIYQ